MSKELDPNKLFNQVSKALQDDDSEKLSSYLTDESPEEEEQPEEEEPTEEEEEDTSETESAEDESEDSEQEEESSEDEQSPPPGKPDGADKEEEEDKPDPLSELRSQIDALKKENHSLRSQAGRVPHLRRKLADLDKKLERLNNNSPSSQTSTKINQRVDELLKDIEDVDPTLAKAIGASIKAASAGVDEDFQKRQREELESEREDTLAEHREYEQSRLLQMHPNAAKVFASPSWAEWKKEQPQHILDLAQGSTADAVSMAFGLYAKDMVAKYPELSKRAEEQKVEEPNPADVDKATKVEHDRAKRKTHQVDMGSRNAGVKGKVPDNPEALFAQFSEQIRKDINPNAAKN